MKSMTAFAHTQTQSDWGHFTWEIRSVNQRFLDLNFKLPELYRHLENPIREQLKKALSRARVEVSLSFEKTECHSNFQVNQSILGSLVKAVNEVQQSLDEATQVNPLEVLKWPGVLQSPSNLAESSQEIETAMLNALTKTMAAFNESRQREGLALEKIIQQRCQDIKTCCEQAQALIPEIIEQQTEKLRQRIDRLIVEKKAADDSRFHQEVALLAQKLDIQEELDRLQTHLIEINHVLLQTGAIGRRLDFLMQELNREANTLGAKSADSRTSQISVELKVLIEQIREQVQNIE